MIHLPEYVYALAGALLLWGVLGYAVITLYVNSRYEMPIAMELLLVLLCGPVVWYFSLRLALQSRRPKK